MQPRWIHKVTVLPELVTTRVSTGDDIADPRHLGNGVRHIACPTSAAHPPIAVALGSEPMQSGGSSFGLMIVALPLSQRSLEELGTGSPASVFPEMSGAFYCRHGFGPVGLERHRHRRPGSLVGAQTNPVFGLPCRPSRIRQAMTDDERQPIRLTRDERKVRADPRL